MNLLTLLLVLRHTRKAFKRTRAVTQEFGDITEEIARNAAAYGFEIGMGKRMTAVLEAGPSNPFLSKDWRDKVVPND